MGEEPTQWYTYDRQVELSDAYNTLWRNNWNSRGLISFLSHSRASGGCGIE